MNFIDSASFNFILLPIIAAIVSGGISIHGVHLVRHIIAQVSVIGMLIGLVIMLGSMSDPDSLGPAFAVMLLVLLYGTIVYGLSTALLSAKPDAPVSSHPPYRRAIACAVFLLTLAGAIGNNLSAFFDTPSIIFLTLSLIILYAILKASKRETIFEALAHYSEAESKINVEKMNWHLIEVNTLLLFLAFAPVSVSEYLEKTIEAD